MKVLIKSMKPHRQRVVTADGEEVRLQKWANKKAAESLRTAGGDASGEQFTQARDMLMRDAVENPEEHGLKFMNERLPFEGQNLESSLSDPMDSPEFKEDMTEDESFSLAEKLDEKDRAASNLFDSEGKLRDGMPPEGEKKRGQIYTNVSYDSNVGTPTEEEIDQMTSEQQRGFDANKEAEHLRRIMTSRQVPMRDAWDILKFGYPSVAGAEIPEEVRARHNMSPFSSKCAKCSKDFSLFRGQIANDICADCQKQMDIPFDTREQQG